MGSKNIKEEQGGNMNIDQLALRKGEAMESYKRDEGNVMESGKGNFYQV